MWCLRCGQREPGDEEFCCKCGNHVGPPDNRLGYYGQMVNLTEDALEGEINSSEYEKTVQWAVEALDDLGKSLEPIEKSIIETDLDEISKSLLTRPAKSFREGIDTFQEGLQQLRYFAYGQNQAYLYKGLSLLQKADNLFNYTADTSNYIVRDISKRMPGGDSNKMFK